MEFRVHGTYPHDGQGGQRIWKCVSWKEEEMTSNISAEELEAQLGIRLSLKEKALLETGDLYLWLNKGFVVLKNGGGACNHHQRGEYRPVGTRAIYLHDGNYSIIEKIK